MVRPLYLQDNFSKTMLAQEAYDRMYEGGRQMRDQELVLMRRLMEERQRNMASILEEKAGASAIRDEQAKERRQDQKKRKRKKHRGQEEVEERWQELRLRRPEDDEGKGQGLDIKG